MGQPSLMTYHNHTDATDRKTMSIIRFEDAANRMLNSAVMPVLNSPLAPLVWPFIATITYTGRRSGKQQGPCLDAIWQHHTVRVDDYTTETRWPDFVAALRKGTDVTSSLSIQLYTNKFELGALNLYSESTGIFTPHIEEPPSRWPPTQLSDCPAPAEATNSEAPWLPATSSAKPKASSSSATTSARSQPSSS